MYVNLIDVPEKTTFSFTEASIGYSERCQKLINAYPDDLNRYISTELQQLVWYIRHKFSATKAHIFNINGYKLHTWMLILSNEAYKKSKQNNDETIETGILSSAHDWSSLLRQINFDDLINDLSIGNVGENYLKCNFFMNIDNTGSCWKT
jgi:hypothetical protein